MCAVFSIGNFTIRRKRPRERRLHCEERQGVVQLVQTAAGPGPAVGRLRPANGRGAEGVHRNGNSLYCTGYGPDDIEPGGETLRAQSSGAGAGNQQGDCRGHRQRQDLHLSASGCCWNSGYCICDYLQRRGALPSSYREVSPSLSPGTRFCGAGAGTDGGGECDL